MIIEKKTLIQKTDEKIVFAFSWLPPLYSIDINLLAIELIEIARSVAYSEKLLHKEIKPYELSPNWEMTNGDNQKFTNSWMKKTRLLAIRLIIRVFLSVTIGIIQST